MNDYDDEEITDIESKLMKLQIYDAFTPASPIPSNLFCGRNDQKASIIRGLNKRGGHVALYGDRGVGKTSLGLYIKSYLSKRNIDARKIECSSADDFASVARKILDEYNISYDQTITTKKEGGINGLFTGKIGTEIQKGPNCDLDNPIWVASKIKNVEGVLIIDEFDTILDKDEKGKFSQFMKYLSDNGCGLHILIVGISRSISELMVGHASIERSLTQVLLPRMTKQELAEIIQKGEERTGLKFEDEVTESIVSMSHGMPYFTHSLALESSIIAISSGRMNVTSEDFKMGLEKALDGIDETLKTKYKNAVGVQGSQNMKRIIYSAAKIGCTDEFTLKHWTDEYSTLFGATNTQAIYGSMANRIGNEPDKIISKVGHGTYIFNDPQMPCYILLLGKP